MGVFTYETETTSAIPPTKLFKAFVLDGDNLIPKVAPHDIKSAEIIEGNGGPRTIKKITFGDGSQFKYVKHRIDEIYFTCCYSMIEGDALGEVLKKIPYEIKIVASPDGGSILKSTSKYHTKGEHESKEEQVKAGNGKAIIMGVFFSSLNLLFLDLMLSLCVVLAGALQDGSSIRACHNLDLV